VKALVKFGQRPGQLELRDVPEPSVRPGAVRVEVKACGICGWDIEMWQHRMANPVTVPVIQGHEFCGVVEQVGPGVEGWRVGDPVACETSAVICGTCRWCRSGDYQLCPGRKGFGYGVDGAFARYVVVRQEILHRMPQGLSFEEAALTEPFCVAHHSLVDQARIAPGDTVLVIGAGPIGLTCSQVAKACGARKVLLAARRRGDHRLALALAQGWADEGITAEDGEVVESVLRQTGGDGADVVADCAGNAGALDTAIRSVRRMGRIVKVGWGPEPYGRSLDDLLRKSAALVGTFGHNRRNWNAVLDMLGDGRLKAKPMISHVLPLSSWLEGFQLVEDRKAVKIVLRPGE
jgi:L-iditol 2-dehydrogenase